MASLHCQHRSYTITADVVEHPGIPTPWAGGCHITDPEGHTSKRIALPVRFAFLADLENAQRAATGIRVRPMVVMTMPVTSGGKNLVMREKIGVISNPISEAAITAPSTAGMPPLPPLPMIATMVATPAKDTPWTNGN
ncbi:hypothetical protein LT17_00252 [Pseudomonas aeruginosa]|nr:hypothetical protein LT17_00252 [Pseudomonas aeruginosa]